jgi:hypothetical protein
MQEVIAAITAVVLVAASVYALVGIIREEIYRDPNRGAFVKHVSEEAYMAAKQEYGADIKVMVFNLQQNYHKDFKDEKGYTSAVYEGITYGVWIFGSGEFTNLGDGGYINWCFQCKPGKFQRNGGHVIFS